MKISAVGLASIFAFVTMSGSAFADISLGPITITLPQVFGAPAPSLAAGIPSLIAVSGALLTSKVVKRFRGR